MKLYQILQWTPFPGVYQPLPEWQLQAAEFDLKLNERHYYEHATQTANGILTYPLETAERIVDYWTRRYPFADYQLKESEEG